MAIDASIYSQIRQPEAPNLLGQYAQAQQIQSMMDQNRLAQLAFQDRERSLADAALQREAVKGFGNDSQANYNRLLQTGNLKVAQDYQKGILDQQKVASEAKSKELETAQRRLDIAGQAFGFVRANPTLENANAAIDYLGQNGVWDPQQVAQYKAHVAANPAQISALADQAFRTALDAKEQLAKVSSVNVGGQTITQGVDPVSGRVTQLAARDNTVSPDAQLQSQTSIANNIRTTNAMKDNAQATRDAAKTTSGIKNEQDLRKEFEGLPEVKSYKQAFPALAAIRDAAKRNTTQSDINIVYGLAKLYDPNSVVREGEYATVANSPNIPERLKGYAQYLQGGGRLTPEVKAQILAEAEGRAKTYADEANKARSSYEEIARRNNLDPRNVFTNMGDISTGSPRQAAPRPSGDFKILGVEGQ